MANQKCTNCSITFSPKNSLRCLVGNKSYSLMNMRQLHILFNSAKTWHVIVCWFLCFAPNLPELSLKLFWTLEQNNFWLSSGKFGAKHRNKQTITCQVLAELNEIWSCLIFIKLYESSSKRLNIDFGCLDFIEQVHTYILQFQVSQFTCLTLFMSDLSLSKK